MKEVITRRPEAWSNHFSDVEKAKRFVREVAKLDYVSSVNIQSSVLPYSGLAVNTISGPTFGELHGVLKIRDSISTFEEMPVYVLSEKDRREKFYCSRVQLMYKRKERTPKDSSAVAYA